MAKSLRKGSRVTGAERDKLANELRKKYDAGQSVRTLAAASGRSYGFVHRMLSESGATLRGRGGGGIRARGGGRTEHGRADADRLAELVRKGIVEPPRAAKRPVTLPRPMAVKGGLSDIVIEQRG